MEYHRNNQLDEAENIYQQILARIPAHADALHLVGEAAIRRTDYGRAEEYLRKAITADPRKPHFHHNLGVALHRQHKLPEAFAAYREAVRIDPGMKDSLNNLALLLQTTGKVAEAIGCYREILRLDPQNIYAINNLGLVYHEQKKYAEAIGCFDNVARLNPNLPEVYNNLGLSWQHLNELSKAEAAFDKAVSLSPSFVSALNNLGNLKRQQGELVEAVRLFDRALEADPDYANSYSNLGNVYREMQAYDKALHCQLQAVQRKPDAAEIHNNIGLIFLEQGDLPRALGYFDQAIRLDPSHSEAFNSKGLTLFEMGRAGESIQAFHKAVELEPRFVQAYNNLGLAYRRAGRLEQAQATFQKTLFLNPKMAEAYCNLGNVLQDQGKIPEAITAIKRALELKEDYSDAHSNLLFCLNYSTDVTKEETWQEIQNWWQRNSADCTTNQQLQVDSNPDRRLKIGYVSPDFKRHSVSYFFLPLLESHDRSQVEIFCYGEVANQDDITEQIKKQADHYCSTVGMTDRELFKKIETDQIDILIDLAGHTAGNRLPVFIMKPAPVQANWLGYPNTTGLPTIDYRLTDGIADPEGEDAFHSEQLIRLPHGFHCYSPPSDAPDSSPKVPAETTGAITFGSFNNLPKLNQQTADTWAAILNLVPNSKLMLKSKQLADHQTREYYLKMFTQHGIAAERIEMLDRTPSVLDHLALYDRMDIGLDPFPYNGTTTTFEALWMGVPVVTLAGNRHAARVGASILGELDLDDLIAPDREAYIDLAVKLAQNQQKIGEFRRTLRTTLQQSPFCNASLFADEMEKTFRWMWQEYCRRL